MNGVIDGTANLYLLVVEYRMGLEVDGLSCCFVFRLNIPQLFFSLFELGFFLLLLVQTKCRVKTGENRPAEAIAMGCVFREYFPACVSFSSFPCSHLAYFQTDPL